MIKVHQGDVCLVDPMNKLGNKSDSISSVIVLGLEKPAFLRRNNIWKCCINYYGIELITGLAGKNRIAAEDCLDIPERMLVPVRGLDESIILRIPPDIPEFTNQDIAAVTFAINTFTDQTFLQAFESYEIKEKDKVMKTFSLTTKQLKTLSIKMEYYYKARNV